MLNRFYRGFVVVAVLLLTVTAVKGAQKNGTETYGYDALSAKLEYLQNKLAQIETVMREDRELIAQKLSHQTNLLDGLLRAFNQLSHTVGHNLTELQTQTSKILIQQTTCDSHEQLQNNSTPCDGCLNHHYRSCKEVPCKESGKYPLKPNENEEQFMGYCEQILYDGGWLVIQNHTNDGLNFYRNWDEYRNGFGNIEHEFWIGLERLHRLTAARSYELVVELEDFSGNYLYAQYDEFVIGNETEQYPLKKVGKYSGTAGDSLASHQGMKFSTFDRDNDQRAGGNCAAISEGGWWYHNCHSANLNGRRLDSDSMVAMNWYHYKNSFVAKSIVIYLVQNEVMVNGNGIARMLAPRRVYAPCLGNGKSEATVSECLRLGR
uniref:Fibrinogen C-terminal domain-containing protein n=1 Tax=Anopheles culicifacies TaxID=139723 RepID=A0A182M8K7_9DIPT